MGLTVVHHVKNLNSLMDLLLDNLDNTVVQLQNLLLNTVVLWVLLLLLLNSILVVTDAVCLNSIVVKIEKSVVPMVMLTVVHHVKDLKHLMNKLKQLMTSVMNEIPDDVIEQIIDPDES